MSLWLIDEYEKGRSSSGLWSFSYQRENQKNSLDEMTAPERIYLISRDEKKLSCEKE
jgi:hypothetical protein